MSILKALWARIQEPKVISVLYFLIYIVMSIGGVSALIDPPSSIAGEAGELTMLILALLLTLGGVIGSVSVLPGIWWLERIAVLSIGAGSLLYAVLVLALHVTQPGNRIMQLAFVFSIVLLQLVRWHRIHERPYDPARRPK